MDPEVNPSSASAAHPETMDFLSHAWCNFAVQALQPELQDQSIVFLDNPVNKFDNYDMKSPLGKMEKSVKMDTPEIKSRPPWKSNDVKSWIWMQQAMHPELNYNSCFRKNWIQLPWKMIPFKNISIKKWLKELKQKRKEGERLQRAEVHAAISIAGVAAALAAIAEENSKKSNATKESAVASAAALVAAQCAQVAESMGAKREQLSAAIGSAMTGTSESDILTLAASATTSLRGAATLKARTGCKNRLNGSSPVLPIDENNDFDNFDFRKCRSILANGTQINIETMDGKSTVKRVSILLNTKTQVIVKLQKHNIFHAFTNVKESVVRDLHAELYKNSVEALREEMGSCYLIVLTTNHGIIKLDMADDYLRYKTWVMTINHMLMLSSSFTRYQLQFYKN